VGDCWQDDVVKVVDAVVRGDDFVRGGHQAGSHFVDLVGLFSDVRSGAGPDLSPLQDSDGGSRAWATVHVAVFRFWVFSKSGEDVGIGLHHDGALLIVCGAFATDAPGLAAGVRAIDPVQLGPQAWLVGVGGDELEVIGGCDGSVAACHVGDEHEAEWLDLLIPGLVGVPWLEGSPEVG